eukprot:SAG31_NODE_4033_length_3648_cov_1.803043_6_plen_251_part_00
MSSQSHYFQIAVSHRSLIVRAQVNSQSFSPRNATCAASYRQRRLRRHQIRMQQAHPTAQMVCVSSATLGFPRSVQVSISHTISCYLIPSHTISCYLILSHTISCYLMLSHTISCYLILSHAISYYLILSHTIAGLESLSVNPSVIDQYLTNVGKGTLYLTTPHGQTLVAENKTSSVWPELALPAQHGLAMTAFAPISARNSSLGFLPAVGKGCYFIVSVQLFENNGTLIERSAALIEKVSPCSDAMDRFW